MANSFYVYYPKDMKVENIDYKSNYFYIKGIDNKNSVIYMYPVKNKLIKESMQFRLIPSEQVKNSINIKAVNPKGN